MEPPRRPLGQPRLIAGWVARSIPVLMAVYAVLAFLSAADRLSVRDARFASVVPNAFGANSLRIGALAAAGQGDLDRAAGLARRAVARDPSNAANLSALGAIKLAARQPDAALAAYRAAAQFGWRDAPTQLFWWRAATNIGDLVVASQRADALLRQFPDRPIRDQLLAPLLASENGREALARRLAENPGWLKSYLADSDQRPPEELMRRADLLARMAHHGAVAGCDAVEPLMVGLLASGKAAEAGRIWAVQCPDADGQVALTNGNFDRDPRGRALRTLDWKLGADGQLDLNFVPHDGGLALQVLNEAPGPREIGRQFLRLQPGRYQLGFDVIADHRLDDSALQIIVACGADRADIVPLPVVPGANRRGYELTIPPTCAVPLLVLFAGSHAGPMLIDNIAVTPAP